MIKPKIGIISFTQNVFLVYLLFVAVTDQSLLTFKILYFNYVPNVNYVPTNKIHV